VISRLQKFLALESRQKILLLQAWCLLGWYRAAILLTSFKKLTAALQHNASAIPAAALTPAQQEEAATIGQLVAAAARVTPWQSLCLVQVLVVQRLLVKRNIPGQFYLGVRKGEAVDAAPTGLAAHAWLQCDNSIVNGGAGHEEFAVVSSFSWGAAHD
jgi:hypothetical protein